MKRFWLMLPLAGALGAGALLVAQQSKSGPGPAANEPARVADLKPSVSLPISQVTCSTAGWGTSPGPGRWRATRESISPSRSRTSMISSSR